MLTGEGTYALTAVKEIDVTEEFLGLDTETINCQNKELFEDCTTRQYLEKLQQECLCVPYRLRNFTENQVRKR